MLSLPAPDEHAPPITLDVSTGEPAVMDRLGPVVVNLDGTLARIANWEQMTEHEQEVTKRRIAKRNIERLQRLKEDGKLGGDLVGALVGAGTEPVAAAEDRTQ